MSRIFGAVFIGLSLAAAVYPQTAEPTPTSGLGAVRIECGRQTPPLITAATESAGRDLIPLFPIVDYLGGRAQWREPGARVFVEGPQGRTAALTLGWPRAVIDGKRLIRLPQGVAWVHGQVMATPETLAMLWRQVGDPAATYSPAERVFRSGPAAARQRAAAAAATPPARPNPVEPVPFKCVVIDPGHGGKDPGAIGPSHLQEKNVVLDIGRDLAAIVGQQWQCRVILTRDDDRFIPLPERPEIANREKADLFVSIHANASPDRKAEGSQVFIYNREASSRKAADTARLENRDTNYLEIIKDDLRQSVHEADSIMAAGLISQEFERAGSDTFPIERAPFYVLAKSHMPSILVETAFISNAQEERKLGDPGFCQQVAQEIFRGLQQYAREKK